MKLDLQLGIGLPPQDPWELRDDFEGLKNLLHSHYSKSLGSSGKNEKIGLEPPLMHIPITSSEKRETFTSPTDNVQN